MEYIEDLIEDCENMNWTERSYFISSAILVLMLRPYLDGFLVIMIHFLFTLGFGQYLSYIEQKQASKGGETYEPVNPEEHTIVRHSGCEEENHQSDLRKRGIGKQGASQNTPNKQVQLPEKKYEIPLKKVRFQLLPKTHYY